MQPREPDCVGRAWWGRGLRDRHPSTTRPTARRLLLGARAPGRQGGASTPSRSHSPRTSSARLVDRTATGATRPWRRQRAPASRPLAGPRPARTLTNAPRDPYVLYFGWPFDLMSRSCTRTGHRGQRAYRCLVAAEGLCTNAWDDRADARGAARRFRRDAQMGVPSVRRVGATGVALGHHECADGCDRPRREPSACRASSVGPSSIRVLKRRIALDSIYFRPPCYPAEMSGRERRRSRLCGRETSGRPENVWKFTDGASNRTTSTASAKRAIEYRACQGDWDGGLCSMNTS